MKMPTKSINSPSDLIATLRLIIFMLLAMTASDIRSFAIERNDSILSTLFPGGKAVGQPYSHNHSEIRMIRVLNDDEAYGIFRRLCGREYIFPVSDGRYHYHACSLAEPYTGYLLYSFHVKPETYEIGVIYVQSPELHKLGIKELHLVKIR